MKKTLILTLALIAAAASLASATCGGHKTKQQPLKVLFELLPHALRDKKLRAKLRGYYETFYEMHLEQLGAGQGADPDLRARMSGLAMLLAAVSDGLTIQMLVEPEKFVVDDLLGALDVLLTHGIPALASGEAQRS